ncbi:MAG: hypothetical protein QUV05_03090 [Phycisphaerae bacterium]|nr:hypothetical protein [Phycisphaerae bacterium]
MNCCPYLTECQYFNDQIDKVQRVGATFKSNQLERIQALAKTYRLEFCASKANFCARHMLANEIGIKNVPNDLQPSHVLRAKEMIEKLRSTATPQ